MTHETRRLKLQGFHSVHPVRISDCRFNSALLISNHVKENKNIVQYCNLIPGHILIETEHKISYILNITEKYSVILVRTTILTCCISVLNATLFLRDRERV